MEKRRISNIRIDDARILFRNFKGLEKVVNGRLVNGEGNRNFCVLIDPEKAPDLVNEGWNIKELRPKEEGDLPQPYLTVGVRFDKYPPKIVMISSKNQTIMTEETIGELDTANIKTVDLVITPSSYIDRNTGEHRIKAYAKLMFVVLEEDDLELKYARYFEEG